MFYPWGWKGGFFYLQPDTAISVSLYDLSGSYAGLGWPTQPSSGLWHEICNTRSLGFSAKGYSTLGTGYPLFRHKLFYFQTYKELLLLKMKCRLLHSDASLSDYRFYSSRTSARSSSVSNAAPQASTDYSPSLFSVFKELGLPLRNTVVSLISNQEHNGKWGPFTHK